jgi:hypothetical protein
MAKFPRDVSSRMLLGEVLEEEDSVEALSQARTYLQEAVSLSPGGAAQLTALANLEVLGFGIRDSDLGFGLGLRV